MGFLHRFKEFATFSRAKIGVRAKMKGRWGRRHFSRFGHAKIVFVLIKILCSQSKKYFEMVQKTPQKCLLAS